MIRKNYFKNICKIGSMDIDKNQLNNMVNGRISVLEVFRKADIIYDIEYTLLKEETSCIKSFDEIDEIDLPDEDFYLDEDDREDYEDFFAPNTKDSFSLPSATFTNSVQKLDFWEGIFSDSTTWHQQVQCIKEKITDNGYDVETIDLDVTSVLSDEKTALVYRFAA